MQALAPQVRELRRQHADDPSRLRSELAKLYADHNARPLAGCLPVLLQAPVMVALFRVLASPRLAGGPNSLLGQRFFVDPPGRTVDLPWQCGSHARQPAGPARARVADRHRGVLRGSPATQPAARRPRAAGESVGSAAARPADSVRRRTADRRPAVLAHDQPLDPWPAVRAARPRRPGLTTPSSLNRSRPVQHHPRLDGALAPPPTERLELRFRAPAGPGGKCSSSPGSTCGRARPSEQPRRHPDQGSHQTS